VLVGVSVVSCGAVQVKKKQSCGEFSSTRNTHRISARSLALRLKSVFPPIVSARILLQMKRA
jgi:hypothetical protein